MGLCVFSGIVVVVNSIVLFATKFTTGGKSSTLIFMRSLCLSDMLIGMFGLFKCVLLLNIETRVINCFLPESLFVSASTIVCLTLLWLTNDSYLRLARPLGFINNMDKHNVIIATMVLWNVGFIMGFLPQMGWNTHEFACDLFKFYSTSYIILICFIWTFCLLGCGMTQALLYRTNRSIQRENSLVAPMSMEVIKYKHLIATIRNDILILTLCYVPLMGYLFYYISVRPREGDHYASTNMVFFLPIFLIRSFISAFIHSYRTVRIQRIMRDISKNMGMSMCSRVSRENSSEIQNAGSLSQMDTTVSSVHENSNGSCNTFQPPASRARKLCSNHSIITIITEEERSPTNAAQSLTKF